MKNATGAGDAFMAAITWAYLEGTNLSDTCAIASAAAAIAVEGAETINPMMSVQSTQRKNDTRIKKEKEKTHMLNKF